MESLWDDRLAEVWASPARAGAGVVVGESGVITARHVVAKALASEAGRVLARVVRSGRATAPWVPMRVVWEAADWDVALLAVAEAHPEAGVWETPRSPSPVIVELGTSAEPNCEAVGFPESAVQHGGEDDPSATVRQSEHAVGTVLPAGQSKPPQNRERQLPRRWFPLDVDTATPGTEEGWGGMSGAGVALPDGRLIGLVTDAETAHQERRLYVVPVATVLEEADGFARSFGTITGRTEYAEARDAQSFRDVLKQASLGHGGVPRRIGKLDDLSAFGVKRADIPGEPTYLHYVARDDDEALRDALREATRSKRMLLVVGASAAGKSRSTAQAARDLLPDHRLVRPQAGKLAEVADLPLARLAPAVVWLDDAQLFSHAAMRETLEELLGAGLGVVGTIRRAELEVLAPTGDVRNPAGEALTDTQLVQRVNWRLGWSAEERERLALRVRSRALLDAAAREIPVGAYCVAGPELMKRLDDARYDEERPGRYALVRSVLDWYRTGIGQPIPRREAARLAAGVAAVDATAELDEALEWAVEPVLGAAKKTRQSLITLDDATDSLSVHDYVLDEDQRRGSAAVPDPVWEAALDHAGDESRFAVGVAGFVAGKGDIALRAWRPLAESGDTAAMTNLGVLLLADGERDAAQSWLQRAVDLGNVGAMYNLGVLLKDSDRDAAQHWYRRAAEAGNTDAMTNLGLLLAGVDPEAAQRWYERAAELGNTAAMTNLGKLLADTGRREAAQVWLRRAAEAGTPRGMFGLGVVLLSGGDRESAEAWFRRAADAGEADAMYDLGVMAQDGDPEGAREWYERAAAAGQVSAMYNLAGLLADTDRETSRRWYERAAEAGHVGAMNMLGLLLKDTDRAASEHWYQRVAESGDVEAMAYLAWLLEERDRDAAEHWYRRAAEAGSAYAMNRVGALLEDRDPDSAQGWYERAADAGEPGAMFKRAQLLEDSDREAARRWYERAAGAGQIEAMNNLALLLMDSDRGAAQSWLERAADAGDTRAINNLGVLLVQDDPESAQRWFQRAADAGNARAMFYLGVLLVDGDPEAARRWFHRAADAGDADAMFNLGVLLSGTDAEEARRWYERAAEAGSAEARNLLA